MIIIMIIYSWQTRLSNLNIQGTEKYSIAMCNIMIIIIMKIMTIMIMIICLGGPIRFCFWNNIDEREKARWSSSLMEFSHVHSQACSWRTSLVTVIARKGDSFQMVRLNVISFIICSPLFSTHFANTWCYSHWFSIFLFPKRNHILTFVHHCFHLLL